jgi:branched-subunit amino acid ABC-type transport system permease component
MKLHLSDASRAGFAAAAFVALAAYAVFGFQHGFEEQVGWYLSLLPGAIVAAAISDIIEKAIPNAKLVTFWGLLVCFNSLWYFGISFAVIKAYRFVSNASKSP